MPVLITTSKLLDLCTVGGVVLAVVIPIEAIYFWRCSKRFLNDLISFWKILAIICIANIMTLLFFTAITSAIFIYSCIDYHRFGRALFLGFYLLLSVLIEWMVYVFFLRKISIKSISLFRISLAGNALSFISLHLIFLANLYWTSH